MALFDIENHANFNALALEIQPVTVPPEPRFPFLTEVISGY
jgi:hypothetical protein